MTKEAREAMIIGLIAMQEECNRHEGCGVGNPHPDCPFNRVCDPDEQEWRFDELIQDLVDTRERND